MALSIRAAGRLARICGDPPGCRRWRRAGRASSRWPALYPALLIARSTPVDHAPTKAGKRRPTRGRGWQASEGRGKCTPIESGTGHPGEAALIAPTPNLQFSVDSLVTHTTHNFTRTTDQMHEVEDARIYAGFHYHHSVIQGRVLGIKVGHQLMHRSFTPVR